MAKRKSAAEQQATGDKIINPTGAGEDQVIKDLVQGKIRTASNMEALDMALALQQIIRGQESLLEMVKGVSVENQRHAEELTRLRQRMAKMDEAAEKYQADQNKFIQSVLDKADHLKAVGTEKDKLIAQGASTFTTEVQKARANMIIENRRFEEEVSRMPKVQVMSPGELQMVSVEGHQEARLFPEVIRIKHLSWVLKPGVPTEVPMVVAQELEKRRQTQAQNKELQDAMSKNLTADKLEAEKSRIATKYGSNIETVPVAENM